MNKNIIELDIDKNNILKIFGNLDSNIKKIENSFHVSILERDGKIRIIGDENSISKAKSIIYALNNICEKGNDITEHEINYLIKMNKDEEISDYLKLDDEVIGKTILGKPIKPKTFAQKQYVDCIKNNMITFAVGPAGTGKTYLGMCMAITAFKNGDVQRLILTRPAIEAGEKLGFLPGDLQSKIDPYLRPLYDALYQILGVESFNSNMEKGLIEVAPLAYMRGRTLDNAFIILDEAQNTTVSQIKMFLTRIGFNSKVVITGDDTQIDLPVGTASGLINAKKVLKNVEGISFINLTSKDVVRHPLVQKIVEAYDKYEIQQNQIKKDTKKNDKK